MAPRLFAGAQGGALKGDFGIDQIGIAFARDMPPEGSLSTAIQVSTMPGMNGMNVFYRMAWTVSVGAFASMVINAARESGGENEVAAV